MSPATDWPGGMPVEALDDYPMRPDGSVPEHGIPPWSADGADWWVLVLPRAPYAPIAQLVRARTGVAGLEGIRQLLAAHLYHGTTRAAEPVRADEVTVERVMLTNGRRRHNVVTVWGEDSAHLRGCRPTAFRWEAGGDVLAGPLVVTANRPDPDGSCLALTRAQAERVAALHIDRGQPIFAILPLGT